LSENFTPVSVIIVTYNNHETVEKCLSSVLSNRYPRYEVVVVDNGSKDDTLDLVDRVVSCFGADKVVKVIRNQRNVGLYRACNIGASSCGGKYLAFLDSDAFVDCGWLFEPVEIMERDPSVGAVQSKILSWHDERVIDSAGGFLSHVYEPYRRGLAQQDVGQYDRRDFILYATGTGIVVRADVFMEVGGFDADFFFGMGDVDLGWRIWLRGYKVLFSPNSRVYHRRRGSREKLARQAVMIMEKNYLSTVIKNAPIGFLFRLLVLYLMRALRKPPLISLARLAALVWMLKNVRRIWYKRLLTMRMKSIDSHRLVSLLIQKACADFLQRVAVST